MPVTGFTKDVERRTLTITAQFGASVERVWAIYADPRQLEQIWGPPTHPAIFVEHSLTVGSRSTYCHLPVQQTLARVQWRAGCAVSAVAGAVVTSA